MKQEEIRKKISVIIAEIDETGEAECSPAFINAGLAEICDSNDNANLWDIYQLTEFFVEMPDDTFITLEEDRNYEPIFPE